MKYNLKKKYQIAMRRAYATENPSKEIVKLLGISKEGFKEHINKFLLPEMKKENFGKEWGLDHIVPVELFDLTQESEKELCYNFLNVIPMFNNDNRIKGASIHFSLEKLKSLLAKKISEEDTKIVNNLIIRCEQEIKFRYNKYLV
jgi:hypothetical protein